MTTANRVLWSLVGVLLLAAGTLLALASLGLLGVDRTDLLVIADVGERWRAAGVWAPATTIVVGLAVAVAGGLLVRAEVRHRGGRSLPDLVSADDRRPPDHPSGRLRVATAALDRALARDISTHAHVRRAAVTLTGTPAEPRIAVRLAVTAQADIAELQAHLDAALTRFAATCHLRPEVTDVIVSLDASPPARVA